MVLLPRIVDHSAISILKGTLQSSFATCINLFFLLQPVLYEFQEHPNRVITNGTGIERSGKVDGVPEGTALGLFTVLMQCYTAADQQRTPQGYSNQR